MPLTEAQHLRQLTEAGATRRYGPRHAERVPGAWAQIDRELDLIEAMDFPGYFLVVWDIVEFCRRESDILCQGRGSAANSAVCFALGITKADAVKLGLLFERFLSPERDGPPDIDLDIESDRREEAIQYVYNRYGRSHAAQVANVITYRARSAMRDAAKALGFAPGQQDAWSKEVDRWGELPAAGEGPSRHITAPATVLDLANRFLDLPRHLGIHSGGMVICDRPVVEVCPTEWARMENRSVLQWDKDDCAAAGLVKFDLLGLGMLSAIHYALDLVFGYHGIEVDLAELPQEDAVYEMLCRADSVGVFQVESRAQMATLPAAPTPLLLRPGGRGRAHPARSDPGQLGAPLHPPSQGRGARHLPAPSARAGPAQDARCPVVPGTAHADGHRRRGLHPGRSRPAPSGHGVQAVGPADGRDAGALRHRPGSSAASRARPRPPSGRSSPPSPTTGSRSRTR